MKYKEQVYNYDHDYDSIFESIFKQLRTKKSDEEILDTIDINIIEKYLRRKKMERLNGK